MVIFLDNPETTRIAFEPRNPIFWKTRISQISVLPKNERQDEPRNPIFWKNRISKFNGLLLYE
ncbi:MAG: hypothetical protein DRR08_04420 [Candidatus Parabeggiatoa sp. nov. 2]|nr:MAG: hypothetical protein B6247_07680 [Beggiatoa sp. 4572_84]RKZ63085.1 MAG: hypothetical protein DRR08_04420 [Gammaproteobacteria bacterium]